MEEVQTTSHIGGLPMSTNRQSWYSPGLIVIRAQGILGRERGQCENIAASRKADGTWRSTESVCRFRFRHVEFAKAEVAQSNMPDNVDEDVFGLQVAVKRD